MENLFWNLRCSSCNKALRLSFPESKLGKTVEAICPDCGAKTKTTIGISKPDQPEEHLGFQSEFDNVPPKIKKAIDDIWRVAKDNPEIQQSVKLIRDEGFGLGIVIALFREKCANNAVSPESKVGPDGEIKPGTFTEKDEEEFREFKIRL